MAKELWIDITNSPHVLVLRPVIDEFTRRGWNVSVTARDYAQTLPLLERFEIPYTLIGKHHGKNRIKKAIGFIQRSMAMTKFGKTRNFDLAVSHASNDLPVASKRLGIPHVTMFDYEYAKTSHSVNIPRSKKVMVPEAITLEALEPYGCTAEQYTPFPGLKEEYYLADFVPDENVLTSLGVDRSKVLVTLRTAPTMADYHRHGNKVFDELLQRIATLEDVQAVVLPRTPDQIPGIKAIGAANLIIPEDVVDAQSLCYFSDLVISAGGTVNREAVALGTPTITAADLNKGAVDRMLIADGRMSELHDASEVVFKKKDANSKRTIRDVGFLVDCMISAMEK